MSSARLSFSESGSGALRIERPLGRADTPLMRSPSTTIAFDVVPA